MTSPVNMSWMRIDGEDGSFDAYLALPPADSGAGLLLLLDTFGVNEHIRSVAVHYALDGFVALAPDEFWHQQRRIAPGYSARDKQRGRALARAIGYCFRGQLVFIAAALTDVDSDVA